MSSPPTETATNTQQPKWHWLSGLLPLLVVVLMLNVLPPLLKQYNIADWSSSQAIVVALLGGIVVVCLMNIHQLKSLLPAINQGANGSLTAIMNTACAVGFGSVVKVVPGCVPSGMVNFFDPSRVGTSISAPRVASATVIGTAQ